MSFHEIFFEFDNIRSSDFPIYIVHMDSGMVSSEISGSRSMIYDKLPRKDNIYFYGTNLDTMKFTITITPLEGEWTDELKFNLFKWLGVRTPKIFRSCDFIGKLCYCMCTNAFVLTTNGKNGYINLEFEATTSYWLSDVEVSTFDLSDIVTPTNIEISNRSNVPDYNGDYYYLPELWIDVKGNNTSFSMNNLSDDNRLFSITNLTANEGLYFNNPLKQIVSDSGTNYLSKFNKNWFRLVYGKNIIKVNTPSIIQFKCQYPIYM